MPRTPLIAGNWKMYTTPEDARDLARAIRDGAAGVEGVDILVCPPFTSLAAVAEELAGTPLALGAQNMYYEETGAFTGEISPLMLAALGVSSVLVGHSERRQHFGEKNETLNRKVKAALAHGLKPILCVGETLAEREAGASWKEVVRGQVRAGLEGLDAADLGPVAIAYEPVWAIGTGKTATPAAAQEAHAMIREALAETFGAQAAEERRILYGGSVKPDNVRELMAEVDVDGALVGGASLKAETFLPIIKFRA
ncbi:MAG: triose-phosphate isomerase [Candidatus Coatesbacteria bacterium]|nr:MAG: triose-phosphate isomerase [Candidatus Coatesbacteria bacterium]